MLSDIKGKLESSLKEALKKLFPQAPTQDIQIYLESPSNKLYGDLSSNVGLRLAGILKQPPQKIADEICEYLVKHPSPTSKQFIKNIEVKSPGFINFFFTDDYLRQAIKYILKSKDDFGRSDIGKGKKVLLEFVSANPTGPLSVAHARQAAVGDALANIFSFLGFKITREYYVNDEGLQIELLGKSIKARYDGLKGASVQIPEGGYQGEYIIDIAKEILEAKKGDEINFLQYGVDYLLKIIKEELKDFQVKMDVFSYQSELAKKSDIEKIIAYLRKKGFIYDQDGAVWFASTRLGDDKDRVLVKSDANFTYLAPDIVYHQNKYKRGFDWIINIWGPDHHGYILRLKAAVEALGKKSDSLSIIIVQLATIFRDGKELRMSTRMGQYISLREVINEVGIDAARFFFLMRRTSSHLIFDLDLAKKQSPENPVYYIQYAHARISSIFSKAEAASLKIKNPDFSVLKEPEEIGLIKLLVEFPIILEGCLKLLDPYGITEYLQVVATHLHKFYDKHRVITEDNNLSQARLALVEATQIVLANGLKLLGVSVPDKM